MSKFKRLKMRVDICYVNKAVGGGWRWELFAEKPENKVFKWSSVNEGHFNNPPAKDCSDAAVIRMWRKHYAVHTMEYTFTIDRDVHEESYE